MKQAFGKLYKGQIRDGMTGAPKVTEVNAKVAERFENMTKKEQKAVEELINDTGERFFSEYLTVLRAANRKTDDNDLCLCCSCKTTTTQNRHKQEQLLKAPPEKQASRQVILAEVAVKKSAPTAAPMAIGAPTCMFVSPPPAFLFPCYAQQPFIPYFANPVCCQKYGMWLCKRIGRPPHDYHCPCK